MENSSRKGPIIYFCKQTQYIEWENCVNNNFGDCGFFHDMPHDKGNHYY